MPFPCIHCRKPLPFTREICQCEGEQREQWLMRSPGPNYRRLPFVLAHYMRNDKELGIEMATEVNGDLARPAKSPEEHARRVGDWINEVISALIKEGAPLP